MGADQSQHSTQSPIRKTETANFDFRYEGASLQSNCLFSKTGGTGGGARETGGKTRENSFSGYRKDMIGGGFENDNNCYWLEVGTDVVKRIDQ